MIETKKFTGTYPEKQPTVSGHVEPVVSATSKPLIDFSKGGIFYWPDGTRSHKCHIVEMIECNMVVFKWYGKYKQWWHYQVEDADHIERMHKIALERKAH